MSSSASRPPEFSESTESTPSTSAHRPSLVGPPKRPVKPAKAPTAAPPTAAPPTATPAAPSTDETAAKVTKDPSTEPAPSTEEPSEPYRQQPISPPSEPMQYRAIGLLRGRYVPTEEAFNRGQIIAQDETAIDAVLLGRVTSLVKKYLDMDTDHLWVVYPRTNPEADNALNVQIVGVWEPETLLENKDDDSPESDETESNESGSDLAAEGADEKSVEATPSETVSSETTSVEASAHGSEDDTKEESVPVDYVPADEIEADVFSIRGEIARYHEDKGEILIGIQQKVKSGNRQQRTFKLLINGQISEKTIGYFWDFEVRREGLALVVHGGSCIAAVPPKKKKKRFGGGPKRFNKSGPRKSFGRRDKHSDSETPRSKPVAAAANTVESPILDKSSPDKPSTGLPTE